MLTVTSHSCKAGHMSDTLQLRSVHSDEPQRLMDKKTLGSRPRLCWPMTCQKQSACAMQKLHVLKYAA